MCVQRCPKCNEDDLRYQRDIATGELEEWGCNTCAREYEVEVEISRHFENMREVVV